MKVHKILQSDVFGPSNSATVTAYEAECRRLFPLATAFKEQVRKPAVPGLPSDPGSVPVAQVKDVAGKTITATGGGVVVLKETSLSSAAMSDLSGDINDSKSISISDNDKDSSTDIANSNSVEVVAH